MDPKAARIRAIGIALYGETGWQSRLAKALDLSRTHMSQMMSGHRRVTREAEDRIAGLLRNEIPRREVALEGLRATLASMEGEMIADVRKPDYRPRAPVHEEVFELRGAGNLLPHWTAIGDGLGISPDQLAALHLGEEAWTLELSNRWRAYMISTASKHIGREVTLEEAREAFGLPADGPEQPPA
ncbi:hypothetical protein ACIKTA_06885 [Hansschlegelia beijingensis]